jgi:hypothetical protein
MPLTTPANVRQTGGISEANAFLLFQVDDDAALNAEVTRLLARASAWLKTRSPDFYTGTTTTETDVDALFAGAEEALTMHYLTMQLKAKRVYGTHFPYDQEGSERFEELIDVEWLAQMEGLIGAYMEVEGDTAHPFALPTFGTTGTVLDTELDAVTVTLGQVLDRAENRKPTSTGSFAFP